jgi:Ser/Thr protein kinase RdoA (MazF antagonist)
MLTALDDLARVPTIGTDFAPITFRENPWNELPDDAQPYRAFLSAEPLQAVTALLQDGALRHQYSTVAAAEPWRGDRLVHYDVRSDNFAYDRLAGVGYLVDWDWIGLGNEAFDRTGLLVNVQLAGYDVLATHRERLDKASLIWLLGFWLKSAVGPRDTEGLRQLRPQQVLSALEAYRLIQRLS